jgi:hypothetical protein
MLRAQAEFQRMPFQVLEQRGIHHAIVLAPSPLLRLELDPSLAGSWVIEFPHPDPYLRDDVIFVKEDADPRALREAFPERRLYRMTFGHGIPSIQLIPIAN